MKKVTLTDSDVADIETALRNTATSCAEDASGCSDARSKAAFEQAQRRYSALADKLSGADAITYEG